MSIKNALIKCYRFIFSRQSLYKINLHFYKLILRSIGILNSEGGNTTGEDYFLKKIAKMFPIEVIFDVGANDGGYSKTLRNTFPDAAIYAFEPHPNTFKRLSKIAFKNKIFAYKLGVGKSTTMSRLWDFAEDASLKHSQPTSTLASVYKNVIEDYHKQKAQSFDINLTSLDDFAYKKRLKKIDFLKIDTEGNEYDVLLGASRLIRERKIIAIQFEFNEMNVYSRIFFKDFMDILSDYKFYRLLPKGMIKLDEYRPVTHEIFAFQNIVAVLKDMADKLD